MTNSQVSLQLLDVVIFAAYMIVTVAFGFWIARKGKNTAEGYFLGNKTIPWFVIGSSMVAADISSEQFISNVGGAYKHGIVLAAGDWNAWIIYSLLILIFLPYYVRTGVTTMPEFLERRYNSTCRYIFAIASVIGFVAAINAGALYSGGIMLDSFFGEDLSRLLPQITLWGNPVSPVVLYIIFFAVTTGVYTIYGGLKSAAWTDLLQMIILLFAGFLVPVLALRHITEIGPFIQSHPEHFQMFKPPTHKPFPFSGVFTGFLSVGIWYSCTSQHMVQRVLAAKDEWHARVGVVCAGFLHIIMPFFFIVPGIIAFKMFPQLPHPDQAYLVLVKQFIPTGLKGLGLAGKVPQSDQGPFRAPLIRDGQFIAADIEGRALPSVRGLDLDQALASIWIEAGNIIACTIAIFIRNPAHDLGEIYPTSQGQTAAFMG